MRRITFIEVLGYLFKFMVAAFVILFTVSLFLLYEGFLQLHQQEKFTVELKENLLPVLSGQGKYQIIIPSENLEQFDGKIVEPVRSCRYGYHIEIECLDKSACEAAGLKNKYSFGDTKSYSPVTRSFPVLISSPSGDKIAASLLIEVSDSPLTRISCMVEKAYKTVSIQSETCIIGDLNGRCSLKASKPPALRKSGDILCVVMSTGNIGNPDETADIECKYLPDVYFTDFLFPLDIRFEGKKVLKAVPVNKNLVVPDSSDCNDFDNIIAREGDEVIVFLCGDDVS